MTPAQKPSFPIRYRNAIRGSDLKAVPKLVALVLSTHMDINGQKCRPGMDLLARETSLNKATVFRALRTLEEAGWLRRHGKGGRMPGGLGIATVFEPLLPGEGSQKRHPSAKEGSQKHTRRVAESSQKGRTVRHQDVHEDVHEGGSLTDIVSNLKTGRSP